MNLKRSATCAVAVMTSLSVSGCSFIFSEGPPPNHQRLPYFDCSTSYAPPVLDTIWGGLNGLGAMLAMSSTDAEWMAEGQTQDRSTVVGVGLVWLAISGASAIYGYNKVGQCTAAKAEMTQRMMRPAPQAWPPAQPTPYPPPGYPAPPPGYPAPPPGYPAPPPGGPAPAPTPSAPPGQPVPAPTTTPPAAPTP